MINIIEDELSRKIKDELVDAKTDEQRAYAAGLSDALDIVQRVKAKYIIGKEYYIIMAGNRHNDFQGRIVKMKLTRINTTKTGTFFCFGSDKESVNFLNPATLQLRVHETEEQAELYINTALLRKYML